MRIIACSSLVLGSSVMVLVACSGATTAPPPPRPVVSASPSASAAPHAKASASAAGASAKAAPSGSAYQPSSGKEAPRPPPRPRLARAEAEKILGSALAAAKEPKLDCDKVLPNSIVTEAFYVAAPTKAMLVQNEPGYLHLARCAEKRGYFIFMLNLAGQLFAADPKDGHPELIARALLGLSREKEAVTLLDKLVKARPKEANIRLTAAKAKCRLRDWATCTVEAQAALASPVDDPVEKQGVTARAQKYLARASLHQGKLDVAERAIQASEKAGGDPQETTELKEALAAARINKIIVEVDYENSLPLGVYHLYGKPTSTLSLATVDLTNVSDKDVQIRVSAEVPGVTQSSVQTITVLKGSAASARFSPPIKPELDQKSLRAQQSAQLSVKALVASAGDKQVFEHSYPVTVEPRDVLPRRRYLDRQKTRIAVMDEFLGAWITPNALAVDRFLTEAKTRAPKNTFAGEQEQTLPQVKAIFETLKARNMSYVSDPAIMLDGVIAQRTRLPSEVLASTNAQCLEGTLTYATLFEAIGLRPVVVRVPGHVFIGWHPSAKDPRPPAPFNLYFVETTMTHTGTFEEAMKKAFGEVEEHQKAKLFTSPAPLAPAAFVEVKALRQAGVTPQPFDQ